MQRFDESGVVWSVGGRSRCFSASFRSISRCEVWMRELSRLLELGDAAEILVGCGIGTFDVRFSARADFEVMVVCDDVVFWSGFGRSSVVSAPSEASYVTPMVRAGRDPQVERMMMFMRENERRRDVVVQQHIASLNAEARKRAATVGDAVAGRVDPTVKPEAV